MAFSSLSVYIVSVKVIKRVPWKSCFPINLLIIREVVNHIQGFIDYLIDFLFSADSLSEFLTPYYQTSLQYYLLLHISTLH